MNGIALDSTGVPIKWPLHVYPQTSLLFIVVFIHVFAAGDVGE